MSSLSLDAEELALRRRIRRGAIVLFLLLIIGAVAAFFLWPKGELAPQLDFAQIELIELRLQSTSAGQVNWIAKYEGKQLEDCRDLIQCLNYGRATAEHNLPDTGQLTIHFRDGTEKVYGLVAGSNPDYYGFRVYRGTEYKLFQTPRSMMDELMRKIGVSQLDPPHGS